MVMRRMRAMDYPQTARARDSTVAREMSPTASSELQTKD